MGQADYGNVFIKTTAPSEAPAIVGSLWTDTTAVLLKRCTSTSPYTWVSVESGGIHASNHQDAGSDEIDLTGLSGTPAALTTHAGAADPHTVYALVAGDTYTGAHDLGGATSVEVPNGAGGTTVDAAGEACVDTTSRTLNFHDGTAEVVLNPVKQVTLVLETPVAGDDLEFCRMRAACTIIEIDYLCVGGTNWVGQVQEADANGLNAADTQAADTTAAAGTNGQVTSFSNASIDAGDYLFLKTTSISGTPTRLTVTVYYRENP